MEKLLFLYLSVSLSASLLIGALLICRPLWKRHFSKSWQYYIWLLAVLRLLIPLSPVPGLIGHAAETKTAVLTERTADGGAGKTVRDAVEESGQAVSGINPENGGAAIESRITAAGENLIQHRSMVGKTVIVHFLSFAWIFWLLPALWILGRKAVLYRRYVKRLKALSVPADSCEVVRICRSAEEKLNIRRKIPVYYCKAAVSPMLTGIRKPFIVLPESDFASSELESIFLHELVHYKRKDILYKWLIELAVSIHWFNPLVYLMRRECSHACELSCDEAVIRDLPAEQRMAYGDTLILSLKGSAGTAAHAASIPLCENNQLLKERLESLLKTKKTTKIQKMAALLTTTCLAASLLLLGSFAAGAQEKAQGAAQKTALSQDYWLNDSDNTESRKWRHSFKTEGFFENQYGIRLAWNNDPALYETIRQVTADETYTVAFTEEMKQYGDDPAVLEAIRLAILDVREVEKNSNSHWVTDFIMKQPVVVGVDGPYQGTYDELAVQFYQEENLNYYGSVLKKASHETVEKLTKRSYEDENVSFFSMTADLMAAEERRQYLEKTYEEDEIVFFSILMDESDSETLRSLAYRAYEEERIIFFSMLADELDSHQCEELAERARRDGRTEYLYVIPGTKEYD